MILLGWILMEHLLKLRWRATIQGVPGVPIIHAEPANLDDFQNILFS